ncbi:MAG: HAD family phosphatase [Candidatus Omnitrophota bacterium]
MPKFKIHPRAIIFDMDGVIVDSMPYHYLAWYEALRPFGVRITCFDVYSREGERWQKSLEDFLRGAHIEPKPATLKKIFKSRQKIFKGYFKRFIFGGVSEFLNCLKDKGYLLGLVTGTPIVEVEKILPLKMQKLFDCIITGDRVENGKPHPEPYLKAAKELKVKQSECVVVENAPLGIRSAKSAGMFCFAIVTSLPKEYLKEADMVVNSLEEITGIIDKTCSI